MGYYKDLREYIQVLDDNDLLVRIRREINKDAELHPLVRWQFRGLPEEKRKAFLFENLTDAKGRKYKGKVAVALLGASEAVYALGMKCERKEVFSKWVEAQQKPIEPILVGSGPVHEEIHMGEELNHPGGGLDEFPIPISTPGFDPAPYITAPYIISKDPEGPFGAKETGEGSLDPTTAAIANAIYYATGVRIKELPITCEKILWGLEKRRIEGGENTD